VLPFYSFLSPASPFPTHWLPRVGSPLFWRYYEDAKTSGCSSPRSSFPSSDGYLLNSISFARLGLLELLPRRLGVGLPVSPLAPVLSLFGGRQSVLSSSQGTLSCFCPALGPRSDLHAKPFLGASILPPLFRLRRLQHRSLFRGSITRLSHRSIRFVPPSLTTTQCSLPAGGQPLPGGLLVPLGPCFVFPSLAFGFDYMIFLTFWVYLTRLNS
jgi:hypothetical protein